MTGVRRPRRGTCSRSTPTTVCSPAACASLRDALERDPRAVAAWGSTRHFGSLDFVQRSLPSLDPWHVTYQNRLPLSALYRRDVLVAVGGWQLEGGYEDWDLWMTLAEHGFEGVGLPELTASTACSPAVACPDSSSRHAERCTRLRGAPSAASAARRANRRTSGCAARAQARRSRRSTCCPCPPTPKRLLEGAACYLAYGSGWPTVAARLRAHQIRRAS